MVVGKVDDHGVVDGLGAQELLVRRQLLDIHHVGEAKQGVDVDAWLQIF